MHQDALGKIRFTSYAIMTAMVLFLVRHRKDRLMVVVDHYFLTTVLFHSVKLNSFVLAGQGAGISPAFQSDGVIVEGLKDGAAGNCLN